MDIADIVVEGQRPAEVTRRRRARGRDGHGQIGSVRGRAADGAVGVGGNADVAGVSLLGEATSAAGVTPALLAALGFRNDNRGGTTGCGESPGGQMRLVLVATVLHCVRASKKERGLY